MVNHARIIWHNSSKYNVTLAAVVLQAGNISGAKSPGLEQVEGLDSHLPASPLGAAFLADGERGRQPFCVS